MRQNRLSGTENAWPGFACGRVERMRVPAVKLSTRLMAAMIALAVLTAATIGLLTYRNIESIALPRALDHLHAHVRLLATELEASVRGARADVLGFRSDVAVEGIVDAGRHGGTSVSNGITVDEWRYRLARRFAAELAANPDYGQFRLVGVADGGREIIRVDRLGPDDAIRIVPNSELRGEGDHDHTMKVTRTSPDDISVSPVELYQEHGPTAVSRVPVIRVAASIFAPDGQPFGAIIVNVDLRPAFSRIRAAAARAGDRIYVTNEWGDYLVHPDRSKEFAFEFGSYFRVQDDFPGLYPVSAVPQGPEIVQDRRGQAFGAATASVRLAGGPWVGLVAMVPYSQILAASKGVRNATLVAGLIAVVLAIVLAAIITRSLTKPIAQMTSAVEAFGRGAPMLMPTDAGGEIGVLAKAFQRMGADVREKAAALAREASERRRLFDTSLDLILVTDRRGRFLHVSPSSTAILGYEPSEMIGRSAISFVHPDDLEPIRQKMRLAHRGQQMRNFETRYLHRDGRVVTLVWSGVWSEPEQRHFFIGRDMTEQKLVEDKFRLAFEASPSGMLMTDEEGRILMVNAETEKLFGYGRQELVGRSVDSLVPQPVQGKHAHHRKAFAAKPCARKATGRDLLGVRKDGSEFPVEVGLNPIRTRDGLVVLSVVVDTTERKRNERLKSEFVATVSHELRTPLTSIAGALRLLDSGALGEVPDPVKRLVKVALDNSTRLALLINDILDIEKLEAGKMKFNLSRTDVKALAEQAIEASAAFADSFNVKLRLEDGAADAAVKADPHRLMQVLGNLLSNAIKFSPPGEEVLVTVRCGSDRVRIGVRDHGPGIAEEFKARIFEKFAQADSSDARRRGGSGLGLSIVRQIVNRLDGMIAYEAAPGGGTIFTVDLPQWEEGAEGDAGGEPTASDAPAAQRPEAAA